MIVAHELSHANHLLTAVRRPAYRHMLTGLKPVNLTHGQVLYEPAERIAHVYFPTDCVVSLLTVVDKRRTLEVSMVGNEGMVGMPLALGIGVSAVRTLVQASGTAMRMTAARFRVEFKKNPPLQRALFRYIHLLIAQVSRTAACNRFHEVEARLACWILMTRDRLHADKFRITHGFLADLLGIRRVSVTQAAGALRRKKLIVYSRRGIGIVDVKGLEAAACSCYSSGKDLQASAQS